ncbi:hypothetical protein Pcinc_042870 [Petrolisthes cinctipes]|uniref:Uncharacterized protein n=1 Tax=Petrolisthes cinctipes TaxID=88211 RepID=A0AAE1BHU5_PETCI|nr:hypothetical protein Pcinc_042870 [Petrolisthes cinctipes]
MIQTISTYDIDGFKFVGSDRRDLVKQRGGGVGLYINKRWCSQVTIVTRDVLKQSFRSESWGLIWIGNGTSRCLASVSLSSRLPGRLDFLPASVLHSGPSWTVLFSIIIILLPSWARQTVFLS